MLSHRHFKRLARPATVRVRRRGTFVDPPLPQPSITWLVARDRTSRVLELREPGPGAEDEETTDRRLSLLRSLERFAISADEPAQSVYWKPRTRTAG
jgi:hypothetical protein